MRAEKNSKRDPNKVRREILDAPILRPPIPPQKTKGFDEWDMVPDLPCIVEAIKRFTQVYFQLGFIPKTRFIQNLTSNWNQRSVSAFWLTSLLATAARFTPSLIQKHDNSPIKAAETYMDRASALAINELYKEPTLERCQAFYLLSIAQQGSGWGNRSYINLGIAIRMACLMRLHREEAYRLQNPTQERIVEAESARRTLWMLHSQDNLHSGPRSPVSLAASDITTLLPASEEDFEAGTEPRTRAALEDTPSGNKNPHLVSHAQRSLFASLIQAHHYWGIISRRVAAHDKNQRPWDEGSDYKVMVKRLRDWEAKLPVEHKWGKTLLKGHKSVCQDLAYLSVTMVTRLCNIVLRRAYLEDMLQDKPTGPHGFWSTMALELFQNVRDLYDQIDTQFLERLPDESVGAQMASFCVYSCALLTVYLIKYPHVCPDQTIASEGQAMFNRTKTILEDCKATWPLASRWLDGLNKFHDESILGQAGTMADGKEPIPQALRRSPSGPGTTSENRSILHADPPLPPPMPYGQQLRQPTSSQPMVPQQPLPPMPPQHYQQTPHHQPQHSPQTPHSSQHIHPNPSAQPGPHHSQVPTRSRLGNEPSNPLNMLIEAFDTHQTPNSGAYPQPTQHPPVTVPGTFYVPPPGQPVAQSLPNDGYQAELIEYIGGPGDLRTWGTAGGVSNVGAGLYSGY